jgi:hypothetical protein
VERLFQVGEFWKCFSDLFDVVRNCGLNENWLGSFGILSLNVDERFCSQLVGFDG